jgi:hypothetical protein
MVYGVPGAGEMEVSSQLISFRSRIFDSLFLGINVPFLEWSWYRVICGSLISIGSVDQGGHNVLLMLDPSLVDWLDWDWWRLSSGGRIVA